MSQQRKKDENINVPLDIVTKAIEGNAAAQITLGKVYYHATMVENNYDIAFDWIYRSAAQENAEAQFKLGELYALGCGTLKNFFEAYHWYTKAAIQGYKKALIRIHNLYQEDIKMHCRGQINSDEKKWTSGEFKRNNRIRELNEYRQEQNKNILNGAIEYYTNQFKQYLLFNQEDPAVQLNLGFLYQHGYGVKKCTRWAFGYYTMAAEQGNTDAQYNLGDLYQKHTDKKFNYRHAFKWYTESAQGGNIAAQRSLAYFYLKGLATDIDYDIALSWYNKAAEAGDSQAQVLLGKLYRKGDCVKQDLLKAVEWYTLAAQQGNIVAQNCLSQLHQSGMLNSIQFEEVMSEYVTKESMNTRLCAKLSIDVAKLGDSPNSKQLNELARHSLIGDGQAMYEIGLKYLKGDSDFTQDQEIGLKWIKNAATAKHRDARFTIAEIYKKGDSVEQDYFKMAIWYKTLAKQKDADGQCNVGIMYNEGLGVREDPLEASKWFIWAADQENSNAQYNLARLRFDGRGLYEDMQEALGWFYKSLHQKHIQAFHDLGSFYFSGENNSEDDKRKGFKLEYAANINSLPAQLYMFLLYKNGNDQEIKKIGLKLMKFAANNGSIQAQLCMASWYKEEDLIENNTLKRAKYLNMAADGGSEEAQYQLALILLQGNDTYYDYVEAYNLFRRANDKGHWLAKRLFQIPIVHDHDIEDYSNVLEMFIEVTERGVDDLHYLIGSMCEYGVQDIEGQYFEKSYTGAIKWYLTASNKGDFRADYRLGFMYERGKGVRKNFTTAIDYYRKASIKGNTDAAYRLACIYLRNRDVTQDLLQAFCYYTIAYTMGHQEASKALMISEKDSDIVLHQEVLFSRDLQIRINKDTKVRMLEKATEEGYARFQYQLGVFYDNRNDVSNSFKWLSLAADIGVTDAQYRLGILYEEGRVVKQDYTMASEMYQKATKKDHEDACYRLGQLYQYGSGVELDYLKAYHFYKKGSDMGHVEAHKVLNITLETNVSANVYIEGNFFDPSSEEYQDSLSMCIYVAESGNTEVQFKIGYAYQYSVSEPNYVEAYNWYSMAAKNSHREAIYHLGLLYEKGLGISQNYQTANRLYKKASQLDSDNAFYQLGNAYFHGNGVEKNLIKAIEYYTTSAELGNPEYQCELGRLYEEGKFVQENLLNALKWYTKAYLQGYNKISSKLYTMYEDKPYEDFFFQRLFQNLLKASYGHTRFNNNYSYVDYGDINNWLGTSYASGYGTYIDLKEAWKYFTKQYTCNHVFKIKNLLSLGHGLNSSEKCDILKSFADDETLLNHVDNKHHLYDLGMLFLGSITKDRIEYIYIDKYNQNDPKQFIFVEKDYSRAFKCLKWAAKVDHSEAMLQLGIMYHCGYGVAQDNEKGDRRFSDATSKDIELVGRVATLYHVYEGVRNFTLAFKWYRRLEKRLDEYLENDAYNRINEQVQVGLGLLYEYSDDVNRALKYYKKLSDINNSIGIHRLALMYYYGKGVSLDHKKAVELLHKVVKSKTSEWEALNHKETLKLFLKARKPETREWNSRLPYVYGQDDLNGCDSQINLVYCIMDSIGIKGESYYYLGLIYQYGQGVSQNQEKAKEHFKQAVDHGCKRAEYEIERYTSNSNI